MKTFVLFVIAFSVPAAALAQPPASSPTQGPLVLERIHNDVVLALDYKVTDVDDRIGELVGGYAGWLAEDTVLVGGGIYSLANRSSDFKLTYGGLLIGWTMPPEHRFQFGARGLVGIGTATLGTDFDRVRFGGRAGAADPRGRLDARGQAGVPTRVRVRLNDDFFVFEPQLTLVTKLTRAIAVHWNGGYRVTGYTNSLDDRLNGVSGSVALQFGF
jgi:hypothetical protein